MNALVLTPRQQRFVDAYSQTGNALRSAVDAGYKPDNAGQQGHALLKNPKVRSAIESALKDSAPIITRDVIVRELWGNHLTHRTDNPQASNRALELLAKLGGMMVERSEMTVTVEQAMSAMDAEIERLSREHAERAALADA